MGKVMRSVVAVVAGFIAASTVMMLIEMINGRFLYPDLGRAAQGLTDREAIRALLSTAPSAHSSWCCSAGRWEGSWGDLSPRGLPATPLPLVRWSWIPSLVAFLPTAYAGARLAR